MEEGLANNLFLYSGVLGVRSALNFHQKARTSTTIPASEMQARKMPIAPKTEAMLARSVPASTSLNIIQGLRPATANVTREPASIKHAPMMRNVSGLPPSLTILTEKTTTIIQAAVYSSEGKVLKITVEASISKLRLLLAPHYSIPVVRFKCENSGI